VLADGRLRVGNETGISDAIVVRSSLLFERQTQNRAGCRLDSQQRVAVEVIGSSNASIARSHALSRFPGCNWGQQEAVQGIRDSIELRSCMRRCFAVSITPFPRAFCFTAARMRKKRCLARPRPQSTAADFTGNR
jgi:hypothetical protein